MSHAYDDIGSILRSMNYEQRSLTLELVSIVAFSCTTIPGMLLPSSGIVDAISESVAEQLDRLSVPEPIGDPKIELAMLNIEAAQLHRQRIYADLESVGVYGPWSLRWQADARLADAQDILVQLRKASA
ncbi:hypothetical protein [Rhodococcus sp. 3-2]|uniref:hypothetical protein n=1 Tax=Rhodococcus sp. 3-2 TaxID=2890836 RepID=UPI001D186731|nr:hypothetical protein [Rhodococcus sp. 3-2]MCC4300400.1 hypothetical protein [Rhodococcus sp. 3-2]MCC4300460.1 hypothetical protein [Rhodococcus sp. 3-2]